MGSNFEDRLLLADSDPQAALEYRATAEEVMETQRRIFEAHMAEGVPITPEIAGPYVTARRELGQLNRICLRHAAVRLDDARRSNGEESDLESTVIHYDLNNPH